MLLIVIFCAFRWIGLSYFMRAEFLRGRKIEYVEAARSIGVSGVGIMARHMLPNTITPIITLAPFSVAASNRFAVVARFSRLWRASPNRELGRNFIASTRQPYLVSFVGIPADLPVYHAVVGQLCRRGGAGSV